MLGKGKYISGKIKNLTGWIIWLPINIFLNGAHLKKIDYLIMEVLGKLSKNQRELAKRTNSRIQNRLKKLI